LLQYAIRLFSVSKPLVFLSYSRKDSEKIAELRRRVESMRCRIWFDREDITGGEWRRAIKQGLRESKRFLACLSRNTAERGEVLQYEWDTALEIQRDRLEGEIYLLPVRLEPCELPPSLSHLQCFDLYEADGWERLSRALPKPPSRLPLTAAVVFTAILGGVFVDGVLLRSNRNVEFLEARVQGRSAVAGRTVRIGLTLWKMQPSQESDPPSVREIVHPAEAGSAPDQALTPVRLDRAARFELGDDFQVTVESSRSGYLYVINRTLFEGGSAGPASLLFPTPRIRGGDNRIWPGALIRLPDREARPPFWRFESSRPGYAGELLIVLLAPQPLEGVMPEPSGTIAEATLAKWTAEYGGNVRSLVTDVASQPLTVEEAAARNGEGQLTRSAPLPGVLFEAERAANAPILLTYSIPVSSK